MADGDYGGTAGVMDGQVRDRIRATVGEDEAASRVVGSRSGSPELTSDRFDRGSNRRLDRT